MIFRKEMVGESGMWRYGIFISKSVKINILPW